SGYVERQRSGASLAVEAFFGVIVAMQRDIHDTEKIGAKIHGEALGQPRATAVDPCEYGAVRGPERCAVRIANLGEKRRVGRLGINATHRKARPGIVEE